MEDMPFISVNAESLGSYAYTDFVYSVTLKRGDASAEVFRFAFGIDETLERYWSVTFDAKEGKITLGDANENALKTASFIFNKGATKHLRIVVNDGIAKVYAKEENAATLTLGLDGYEGGYVDEDLIDSHFEYHDASLMSLDSLSGDIYVGGYEVLKVVNLTDGNRVLAADEFTLNQGLITIDPAYLDTLENDALYKFRAVTSFTDFDFYVQTDEVGAELYTSVVKNYRGDDIRFELSEPVVVYRALVDGNPVDTVLSEDGMSLSVPAEAVAPLPSGEHTLKVFTDKGRPEARFSLYTTLETIPEIPAPVNHTYFFIDIAIFAVLIVGYLVFSKLGKRGQAK